MVLLGHALTTPTNGQTQTSSPVAQLSGPNITKQTQNGLGFGALPHAVLTGGKALYSSTNQMPANSSPPLRRFLGLAGEPRFLGLAGGPRDPPLNIAPLLDFGTRAARFREPGNPSRLDRPMHFGRGRVHTAHAKQMAADYNQGFLQLQTLTQNYSWRFPSVATWCAPDRAI